MCMTFIQYFMLVRINKKIMSETLLVGHEEKHVLFFMMRNPVFLLSVMCVLHTYISPFRHCLHYNDLSKTGEMYPYSAAVSWLFT